MFNSDLYVRGSIHQGNNRFGDVSRGRQCAFMSLSALLWANSCDISTWNSQTIDQVLIEGDALYLTSFENYCIPDEETISLNYLPDRVNFPAIQQSIEEHLPHNQQFDFLF